MASANLWGKAQAVNAALLQQWRTRGATPFPGQLVPFDADAALRCAAECANSTWRLEIFFEKLPALAVWATLDPLAQRYGASSKDVYVHIGHGLRCDLDAQDARDALKRGFRKACRELGVKVTGNHPNDLFFPLLGVADAQTPTLADGLVRVFDRFGPPATEDTSACVAWQREVLRCLPETWKRPRSAIAFDQQGYYAVRANAWRRSETPTGARDRRLFEVLDRSAAAYGLRKDSILAPPRPVWFHDGLALLPEPASVAQTLRLGPFPRRVQEGHPVPLPMPWPDTVWWQAHRSAEVRTTPESGQLWVFDAETGAMEGEAHGDGGVVPVKATEVVLLARGPFSIDGSGSAWLARDPAFFTAWVDVGAGCEIELNEGKTIHLQPTQEPCLRVRAPVLGARGARVLRAGAGEGVLEVQVDPALAMPRVLRVTHGNRVAYASVSPGADGRASIPFSALKLDMEGAPGRALFELLVPGVGSGGEGRAELSVACYVWLGVARCASGNIEDVPAPTGFDPARSAGWTEIAGRISMDAAHPGEAACLAVRDEDGLTEYDIPFRGLRVWRHRPGEEGRARMPLCTIWPRDHAARQDALVIEGGMPGDDVIVFGRPVRKPFRNTRQVEIPAAALGLDGQDDQIVLQRADGSRVTLVRVVPVNDPIGLMLDDADDALRLMFQPPRGVDAVGVMLEDLDGGQLEGFEALGPSPVERPLPPNVSVVHRFAGAVTVEIVKTPGCRAARATVCVRIDGDDAHPLRGADGHPVAMGCPGSLGDPRTALAALARLTAEPSTAALGDQLHRTMSGARQEAIAAVAQHGMVRPLLPALECQASGGRIARGDVVGAAPWVFSRALTAFGALTVNGPLDALRRIRAIGLSDAPDPRAVDAPGLWLDRIALGDGLPDQLGVTAHEQGFGMLRLRLDSQGGRDLLQTGALGGAAQCILRAHSHEIDRLRAFDLQGGQDAIPARIAALLERFARASRLDDAEVFLTGLCQRTGLDRPTVGEVLTVAIRCAPELFAMMLMFWDAACRACAYNSEGT